LTELHVRFIHFTVAKQTSRDLVENIGKCRALGLNVDRVVKVLEPQVFHRGRQMPEENYEIIMF
jgi:hypothetical protein